MAKKEIEQITMPRVGVIGCGVMGSGHIRSLLAMPRMCKLTAVCDIRQDRLDEAIEASKATGFDNASDLFKSGLVDAITIATPHYSHEPLMIEAMANGIHVLVEKPIAVSKEAAQRMIECSQKHPELKFAAMFQQRTYPAHRKIKEMLDSGKLGKIYRAVWIITDWFRTQTYYDSGDWRATWQGEGGGVLFNQCPHQLDLCQWFFGLPKRVSSQLSIGKYHNIEVEDEVNSYWEYDNGMTANFITTTGEYPGTNRLEISGSLGSLIMENHQLFYRRLNEDVVEVCADSPESFATIKTVSKMVSLEKFPQNPHGLMLRNFVKSLRDGVTELVADGKEGLNSVELANSMLYSGLKKETVTLPLDAKKYEAMLNELQAKGKKIK